MPFLKIENLTNSPFDLEGGVILPAFGSVVSHFSDAYAELLVHSMVLTVENASPKENLKPVGEKGPETFIGDNEPDIDDLRLKAEELGIDIDRRWGVKRLQQEIADAS